MNRKMLQIFVYVFFHLTVLSSEEFDLKGYYKNLLTLSETISTNENFWIDLNRVRLDAQYNFNKNFQAKVVYDAEVFLNDFHETFEFNQFIKNNNQNEFYFDADKELIDEEINDDLHLYSRHSLHRIYLKMYTSFFQVVIGKQKIDWGRTFFWSPFDLFNPITPLDIEQDEKKGVDAIDLNVSIGSFSGLNIVYAPHDDSMKEKAGVRAYTHFKNFDFFLLGGEFREDEIFGLGFDGSIGNWGVKGEWTRSETKMNEKYSMFVLGAEYRFSKIHLLSEYFHFKAHDSSELNASRYLEKYSYPVQVDKDKKDLFGLYLSWEITPIFKWDHTFIVEMSDESHFYNPVFKYNITDNFDFSLGSQFFGGDQLTEFGDYQDLHYIEFLKYF